ncbi:MAG TPA: Ku protein [candidate division Zixibacteria bacterium]|nr:Ku protein [candidate division Zixibacteria bacterium]
MAARPIGSGTISFGLVSIPVRLYPATSSQAVSFHMLHAKCGSRIRQQRYCPVCEQVVEREELVRGYEFARDQYVRVTEEELKSLEGEASQTIEIAEFVPLSRVDPVYFEKSYYLGPDKGGEKAYRLLTEAMARAGKVAVAKFILHGKENIVLLRPARNGLMLHTMYFADEVRDFGEVEKGDSVKIKEAEVELALRLIHELSSDDFTPERYEDEYRKRVLDLVTKKAEGREITLAAPRPQRAQVIDLMAALKESLARTPAGPKKAVRAEPAEAGKGRKKRAQAGKK